MLTMNNQSNYIRKELTVKLLNHFFNDTLEENIDRIPIEMNPKRNSSYRCCTYKDRAMIRYRIMALLGISIEEDDDEFKPLKDFYKDARSRSEISGPVITVIDTACSSCRRISYTVTDSCRGCLARPCRINCPFDAITIINGRAVIDHEKCRNCGKCEKMCPFNAIIHTPVPCEESCPVGAVSRDEYGTMCIDYDKCIFCGRCSRSCPFGAVMERSQLIDIAGLLKSGRPVTAMIAPSVIGQFPGSIRQLVSAVKKAGFTAVLDVAAGAVKTAEVEAAEFEHRVASGNAPLMTTSCCPAWVEAAEKHITVMKEYISTAETPLYYTAEEAGRLFPDAVKVFIGPCTAKKVEAIRDGSADYVMSFEELGALFIARGIDVNDFSDDGSDETFANGDSPFSAKAFAASGGVSEAVAGRLGKDARIKYKPLAVDGLSRKNINLLKTAASGKTGYNMIEVMSCEGGCICGPGVISNPKVTMKKLKDTENTKESA